MKSPTRIQSIFGVISVGFLLMSGSLAFAQHVPNLAIIRQTSPVSPLDRQNIQKWSDDQIDALFSSAAPDADSVPFKTKMLEHFMAADATPAFKETLAQAVSAALSKRYDGKVSIDGTNGPRPLAVVAVLILLDEYKEVAALNVFKAALAGPTSGIRFSAAKGLFGLRSKMTAQQWTALLPDIKKAATDESNPGTLAQIYRLLSVDPKTDPPAQEVLPIFIDVLKARLTRYEQQNQPPCAGEAVAVEWLKEKALAAPNFPRMNDVVLVTARLLANSVLAFTDPRLTAPQKEPLDNLIWSTEEHLKEVAKAGGRAQPDISKILTDGGPTVDTKLVDELNKWIGNGDAKTDGFLNQAPYNLPLALGITRAAPATSTAPAG